MCKGLTHLAGFVGVVLAIFSTAVNDWVIIWISQHNHGIYEPEFRLVFMPSMLFGLFSFIGWAVGNTHGMSWVGAVACYMYVLLRPNFLFPIGLLMICALDFWTRLHAGANQTSIRKLSTSDHRPTVTGCYPSAWSSPEERRWRTSWTPTAPTPCTS